MTITEEYACPLTGDRPKPRPATIILEWAAVGAIAQFPASMPDAEADEIVAKGLASSWERGPDGQKVFYGRAEWRTESWAMN